MKIFARPTSATIERNKKMPRYDRMGSRYANAMGTPVDVTKYKI